MDIKFAKLYDDVIIPSKRDEDAGLDIYAHFENDDGCEIIMPHQTKMIHTGLISVIEPGYFVKLCERGSTGTKGMGQRAGVIDSGYRGEWIVPITNLNDVPLVIAKNNEETLNIIRATFKNFILYPYEKAVCQAIVLPCPTVNIGVIDKNDVNNYKSERGDGRCGSSNK